MYYETILVDFEKQLEQILVLYNTDTLLMTDKGYSLCAKTLVELRNHIEKNGFANKREEIEFFKYHKTIPMQYLIYFTEVRSCELRLPKIGVKQQEKYLQKRMDKMNTFFGRHIDFLLYMEQDLKHFDKLYFTRKNIHNGLLVKSYPYFKDPIFNNKN